MRYIDNLPSLPVRPADGHKGTFGRVLIIAGSRGMSGAACLAGISALRAGSGLVFLAVPDGILPIVAAYEPSYLTVPLPDDDQGRIAEAGLGTVLSRVRALDAVAIGPGLGQSAGLRSVVLELYRSLEVPMVVDADALNLLATSAAVLSDHAGPRVLTPHIGEFARLTHVSIETIQQDRETHAVRFAGEHGVSLILKGPGTIIAGADRIAINSTGNSGMATGGTGDVLTGLIVSLIGQGLDPFDAAHLGVHLHGLAGDIAADELTERALIASDLPAFFSDAWRMLED